MVRRRRLLAVGVVEIPFIGGLSQLYTRMYLRLVPDDPQIPGRASLIKEICPREGCIPEEVCIWNNIKHAELFVSHAMRGFVSRFIPVKAAPLGTPPSVYGRNELGIRDSQL